MVEVAEAVDTVLFSGCSAGDLKRLLGLAHRREYADGQLVFAHGDDASELLVVMAGKVRLELPVSILGESKNLAFETKGRGDVVGWSALVPPHRFTLSGRCNGPAAVLAFPRADLLALFESEPALGFVFMRNLAVIVGQRWHHMQALCAAEVQRGLDERYR